jgi:hypothetical protein
MPRDWQTRGVPVTAVYVGPSIAALVAIAIGVALLLKRERLTRLYDQAGKEQVGRIFVPALGALWLVIGLFGLVVSLVEA